MCFGGVIVSMLIPGVRNNLLNWQLCEIKSHFFYFLHFPKNSGKKITTSKNWICFLLKILECLLSKNVSFWEVFELSWHFMASRNESAVRTSGLLHFKYVKPKDNWLHTHTMQCQLYSFIVSKNHKKKIVPGIGEKKVDAFHARFVLCQNHTEMQSMSQYIYMWYS